MLWRAAALLIGLAAIGLGLVLYAVLPDGQKEAGLSVAVPSFLALVTWAGGAVIHKLARLREYRAVSASELLAPDTRPPVLYLRSFRDDPAASARTPLGMRTAEEQMVAVLRRIGPVVALGTRGERRHTLGAAREYVVDERWKQWVLDKMRAASLTLFRTSNNDAFWWEVEMAAKHVSPDKVAFLLPQDAEKYAALRARVTEHFPAAESLRRRFPNSTLGPWGNCRSALFGAFSTSTRLVPRNFAASLCTPNRWAARLR
jgi:hypothetical protein